MTIVSRGKRMVRFRSAVFILFFAFLLMLLAYLFYLRWHGSDSVERLHPHPLKEQLSDPLHTYQSTRNQIATSKEKASASSAATKEESDTRQTLEMPQRSEEIEAKIASIAPPLSEKKLVSQISVPKEHEETIEEAERILDALYEERAQRLQTLEEQMTEAEEQMALQASIAEQEEAAQDRAEEPLGEEEALEEENEQNDDETLMKGEDL